MRAVRRIARFEDRLIPTDIQPIVIQIQSCRPDGSVKDGPRITVRCPSEDTYQRTAVYPSFRRDAMTARFPRGAACAAHLREQSSCQRKVEMSYSPQSRNVRF